MTLKQSDNANEPAANSSANVVEKPFEQSVKQNR